MFGLIIGITERTWQCIDVDGFVATYCRPAKGEGYVSVWTKDSLKAAQSEVITSSKQFSEAQLAWSRALLAAVRELGFPTEEQDMGRDA